MKTYFTSPKTLEELRKQYKDLLKRYHPDNPSGSEEATKAINTEYETLFKALKDIHSKTAKDITSETYDNMKWDYSEDEALRDMFNKVIQFAGINITIVGNWIWVDGNTYPYKAVLKESGFKWAREKKRWYWHSETFRKKSHKNLSFDSICNYYGSADIKTEHPKQLEA